MGHRIIAACMVLGMAAGWSAQAEAALITYAIQATENTAPGIPGTFTGSGSITLETSPATAVGDIAAFRFDAFTEGSIGDGPGTDVIHRFSYSLSDVETVDLAANGSVLSGMLGLADKESVVPAVVLEGLSLNFSDGTAMGFCFDAVGGAQCIRGGGTSTGLEANLGSAFAVPEPPVPLAMLAAGLLTLGAARLRRRQSSGR